MGRRDKDNYFYCEEQPVDQQISKKVKKVTKVWLCRWRYRGQERFMVVVVEYLYDGGSIPRIGWTILGITPSGPGDCGFLPHDVLYRAMGGLKPEAYKGCTVCNANGNAVIIPRREADWVMRAGMEFGGITKRRAGIAYGFVRTFGGILKHWGGPIPALR